MGVVTFTDEFSKPLPAKRLFTALVVDADNLVPKVVPHAIKNVELLEGTGGAGSTKRMNFAEGSPYKYLTYKIDELDVQTLKYRYTVIGGDVLDGKLESISYDVKLEAAPNGGCKGTIVCKYNPKPGVEIKEDFVKADKERADATYKAVEAYLLANPEAYD